MIQTETPDRRQTIAQIIEGYDPFTSTTLLMLPTCLADFGPRLVVVSVGEISDQDWAIVLDTFPICGDYDYDYGIHDELHVIVITPYSR